MILPNQIKGRNRIRDAQIIDMFVRSDCYDQTLIAKQFGVTQSRVAQILKLNASIVLSNADWERVQRLKLIKNSIDPNDKLSKRDAIDLWRKEYDGDDMKVKVVNNFFSIEKSPTVKNRLDEVQT